MTEKIAKHFYATRAALGGSDPHDHNTLVAIGCNPDKHLGRIHTVARNAAVMLAQQAEAMLRMGDALRGKEDKSEVAMSSYARALLRSHPMFQPGPFDIEEGHPVNLMPKEEFLRKLRGEEHSIIKLSPHIKRAHALLHMAEALEAAGRYQPELAKDKALRDQLAALKPLFTLVAIDSYREASKKLFRIGEKKASQLLGEIADTLCEINDIEPAKVPARINLIVSRSKLGDTMKTMHRWLDDRKLLVGREWPSVAITAHLAAIHCDPYKEPEPQKKKALPEKNTMLTFAVEQCGVGVRWNPKERRLILSRPTHPVVSDYRMEQNGEPEPKFFARTEAEKREAADSLMSQLYNHIVGGYPQVAPKTTLHTRLGIVVESPPQTLLSELRLNYIQPYRSQPEESMEIG